MRWALYAGAAVVAGILILLVLRRKGVAGAQEAIVRVPVYREQRSMIRQGTLVSVATIGGDRSSTLAERAEADYRRGAQARHAAGSAPLPIEYETTRDVPWSVLTSRIPTARVEGSRVVADRTTRGGGKETGSVLIVIKADGREEWTTRSPASNVASKVGGAVIDAVVVAGTVVATAYGGPAGGAAAGAAGGFLRSQV